MRVPVQINDVTVLSRKENVNSQNGNHYYKIGILTEDELGELSCSEEVFKGVVKNKVFTLFGTFNTDYKSLSINGAVPVASK